MLRLGRLGGRARWPTRVDWALERLDRASLLAGRSSSRAFARQTTSGGAGTPARTGLRRRGGPAGLDGTPAPRSDKDELGRRQRQAPAVHGGFCCWSGKSPRAGDEGDGRAKHGSGGGEGRTMQRKQGGIDIVSLADAGAWRCRPHRARRTELDRGRRRPWAAMAELLLLLYLAREGDRGMRGGGGKEGGKGRRSRGVAQLLVWRGSTAAHGEGRGRRCC